MSSATCTPTFERTATIGRRPVVLCATCGATVPVPRMVDGTYVPDHAPRVPVVAADLPPVDMDAWMAEILATGL